MTPVSSSRVGASLALARLGRGAAGRARTATSIEQRRAGPTRRRAAACRLRRRHRQQRRERGAAGERSTYGSASGLRSSTCISAPASASSPPMVKPGERARQAQAQHDLAASAGSLPPPGLPSSVVEQAERRTALRAARRRRAPARPARPAPAAATGVSRAAPRHAPAGLARSPCARAPSQMRLAGARCACPTPRRRFRTGARTGRCAAWVRTRCSSAA